MLFARAITLRNCGRFTVIASDFGSDYRTHTHVTSEALYASLTRGATWRPRLIDLKDDPEDFARSYNVAAMPVWFLPGAFLYEGSPRLPDAHLDTTAFNVVHEFYPSTSKAYVFKRGQLEDKDRPNHVPTYGTIQAVIPNQRFVTYCISANRDLLQVYEHGQTFFLGKKRTMFQIVDVSEIVEGVENRGSCDTSWLELNLESLRFFSQYEILTATMRYVICRGRTTEQGRQIRFRFEDNELNLPDFYIRSSPIGKDVYG